MRTMSGLQEVTPTPLFDEFAPQIVTRNDLGVLSDEDQEPWSACVSGKKRASCLYAETTPFGDEPLAVAAK